MSEKLVDIDIEMDDKEFLVVAKMAHEHDITFNQMINKIFEWYINNKIYLEVDE